MFVPTKTILWMPNAFYKPNTPAIPINSQRLHKFCEWRLCRGDPEIHRQIPTMHFGDPLEEDLNPRKKNLWSSLTDKYQSFRSSNSGALRFQDEETNFIKMFEDFKKNRR